MARPTRNRAGHTTILTLNCSDVEVSPVAGPGRDPVNKAREASRETLIRTLDSTIRAERQSGPPLHFTSAEDKAIRVMVELRIAELRWVLSSAQTEFTRSVIQGQLDDLISGLAKLGIG